MKQTFSMRNCNPCNIRFSRANKWLGQIGFNRGFCKFKSDVYGFRAFYKILDSYAKRGCIDLMHIIDWYAPASDNNDTIAYFKFVSGRVDFDNDFFIVDRSDYVALAVAFAQMEGTTHSKEYLNDMAKLAFNMLYNG